MESHLEARLWNEVFAVAEEQLGIAYGPIRATVLIETIPAAFEMEEILYELHDHASGLNAGQRDYLFSIIKYFRDSGPDFVLPDRNAVTVISPFMRAYAQHLVKVCHRHGAHAIGGMAAFIPAVATRRSTRRRSPRSARTRNERPPRVRWLLGGTPDPVPICQEKFDAVLGEQPHQIGRQHDDVTVGANELLDVASTPGSVTAKGLRNDVSVAVQYLASWLSGNGAVAINNLMEDAATAEIARSQVWQWLHNNVRLDDRSEVTGDLVRRVLDEEVARIQLQLGSEASAQRHVDEARSLFEQVALDEEFVDFLTLPAYDLID
jgi:malate synthase